MYFYIYLKVYNFEHFVFNKTSRTTYISLVWYEYGSGSHVVLMMYCFAVMLDEKRLGAGVRPTFHNHPEERVIANVDHINAHHVYRHNNDAEEQTQQTARTTNDQSTVRQLPPPPLTRDYDVIE